MREIIVPNYGSGNIAKFATSFLGATLVCANHGFRIFGMNFLERSIYNIPLIICLATASLSVAIACKLSDIKSRIFGNADLPSFYTSKTMLFVHCIVTSAFSTIIFGNSLTLKPLSDWLREEDNDNPFSKSALNSYCFLLLMNTCFQFVIQEILKSSVQTSTSLHTLQAANQQLEEQQTRQGEQLKEQHTTLLALGENIKSLTARVTELRDDNTALKRAVRKSKSKLKRLANELDELQEARQDPRSRTLLVPYSAYYPAWKSSFTARREAEVAAPRESEVSR